MYADIREAWIEDLRTTTARQGAYGLCSFGDDGEPAFCCLGRLVVVMDNIDEAGIRGRLDILDHGLAFGVLQSRHAESAGIVSLAPTRRYYVEQNPLLGHQAAAVWNDYSGKTFSEIADLIERYVAPIPRPENTDEPA